MLPKYSVNGTITQEPCQNWKAENKERSCTHDINSKVTESSTKSPNRVAIEVG